MATIIKVDGTQTETTKVDLESLQRVVGGYIEMVYVRGQKKFMAINEDGIREKLPNNPEASRILGQPIVGDVIILTHEESNR